MAGILLESGGALLDEAGNALQDEATAPPTFPASSMAVFIVLGVC
jgi:hypothetical protein